MRQEELLADVISYAAKHGMYGMKVGVSGAIEPCAPAKAFFLSVISIRAAMPVLLPIEGRAKVFDVLGRLIATWPRQRSPRDA